MHTPQERLGAEQGRLGSCTSNAATVDASCPGNARHDYRVLLRLHGSLPCRGAASDVGHVAELSKLAREQRADSRVVVDDEHGKGGELIDMSAADRSPGGVPCAVRTGDEPGQGAFADRPHRGHLGRTSVSRRVLHRRDDLVCPFGHSGRENMRVLFVPILHGRAPVGRVNLQSSVQHVEAV